MNRFSISFVIGLVIVALVQPLLPAAEQPTANAARRQVLIICGLTGDAAHRELFAGTIEKLYQGLTTLHGFAPGDVIVLWSDGKLEPDGPAIAASRGPATRETLAAAAAALQQAAQPGDALWVFVLGHAHYDGRYSWLNLPGSDLQQLEFAKLFADIRCREQVFFMTTAASGFFVKPLSLSGRVVISATEADREVNETLFPHKLAAALAEPPPILDFDVDGDGRATLLDAYLWTARETAKEYATGMLLATEHSLLDDNGDGRGTETQANFLPEELGGKLRAGRETPTLRAGDGELARRIFLAAPPGPPVPPASGE